jgi:hypothetical protein|tara:strand:+ start:319 stop:561 length:243 start_codon:yes stop_codon:yes gene_type:complete
MAFLIRVLDEFKEGAVVNCEQPLMSKAQSRHSQLQDGFFSIGVYPGSVESQIYIINWQSSDSFSENGLFDQERCAQDCLT